MTRSAGVTLTAVVVAVFSGLFLLAGILVVASFPVVSSQLPQDALTKLGLFLGTAMFVGGGVWGLITAFGLYRLRRWARVSLLTFSGLLVFLSISTLLVLAVQPLAPQPGLSETEVAEAQQVMAAVYAFAFLLGLWWLWLFTRASIKEQFSAGAEAPEGRRRPLSILLIGWLLLLGGVMMPIFVFLDWPATVLGCVVTGWVATAFYLFFAVAHIYMGVGLLRLDPLSRTVTIWFQAFALASVLLFVFLPGREARLKRTMGGMPPELRSKAEYSVENYPWTFSAVVGLGGPAAVIWFLIRERRAFENPPERRDEESSG